MLAYCPWLDAKGLLCPNLLLGVDNTMSNKADFMYDMILCSFIVLYTASEFILLCVPFLFEVTLEPDVALGINLIGILFFARRLALVVACPTGTQQHEHRQADEALVCLPRYLKTNQ